MASYKVPQDVEAEDKIIGPFGWRQFIYLIIVAFLGFLGYVLYMISPFLIVIPLPFALFLLVLALPLRKEQPMEIYVLALIKFFFKPRLRLWIPEGTFSYVMIAAVSHDDGPVLKDFGDTEARRRLSYLSQIVDTQGWAARGVAGPTSSTPLNETVYSEAAAAEDVLDDQYMVAQNFNVLIDQNDVERRKQAINTMLSAQPATSTTTTSEPAAAGTNDTSAASVTFDPYPTMHQRVISPKGKSTQADTTQKKDSEKAVPISPSPDIINLAGNTDLSISSIAREAHRLEEKNSDEVVIKLH